MTKDSKKDIPPSKEVAKEELMRLEGKFKTNEESLKKINEVKDLYKSISTKEDIVEENSKKLLELAIDMGKTKQDLLDLGFNEKEIVEVFANKKIKEEKVGGREKRVDEKEREEKINKIFEQLMFRISERKADEKKLAELIELRKRLVLEEDQSKNKGEENENPEIKNIEIDMASPEKTKPIELYVASNEDLKGLEELRLEFIENMNLWSKVWRKYKDKQKELESKKWWQFVGKQKANNDFKKESEREETMNIKIGLIEEKFEAEARKKFPFPYYVAEKIQNQDIRMYFTKYRRQLQNKVEAYVPYISMQKVNPIRPDNNELNPMYILNESYNPEPRDYNDYCLKYNIYGFSIKLENPEEIKEGGGGVDLSDPKVKYKVLDPNGKILMENVDLNNAEQIFEAATEKYRKEVEQEFDKMNSK